MKKYFKGLFDGDGSEIAELAIVMPLLFTLILGIYSFGRAYNIYATVTRAAQDAARVAAAPVCANCSQPSCSGGSSQFPCDPTIAQVIIGALNASNLDPNRVSQVVLPNSTQGGCPPPATPSPNCNPVALPGTSSATVYICRDVLLNNTGTAPACGTTVSFQYNYQFLPVPFMRMNSFNIPAQAQVTTEY
jgi:hypothetical protein